MIDMGVRKNECVNRAGIEWKVSIDLKGILAASLIQPAVEQQILSANFEKMHRASDRLSCSPELDAYHESSLPNPFDSVGAKTHFDLTRDVFNQDWLKKRVIPQPSRGLIATLIECD